jgi:uncharacterized protein YhaN
MSGTTGYTPASHTRPDTRERLAFSWLEIARAPGISPGFTIDDLNPDINIIYGPNASGKSTTARAIQALIWPHPSSLRGHSLRAGFALGDEPWEITTDAGRITRTRNGEPASPRALAPIDDRMRYTLGLHDLLASENQPLAQAIMNESAGGFDLESVAEALGYNPVIPTRHEAARAVESATSRLRDARRATDEVAEGVRHLEVLRNREREARAAAAEADALRKALDLIRVRAALDAARDELAAFPQVLDRLEGDEPEQVSELNTRIEALEARQEDLQRARDRAAREADATSLADREIGEGVLQMLREGLDDLRRNSAERERAQRDLQSAHAERESHQRRLAAELSDQQMASLDADGIRELAGIAHSYEEIRARRRARDEVELWIGGTRPPENLETLKQGVEALSRRIQHPNRAEAGALAGRAQMAAYIGGALAIAGAIWLANFVDPLWLLFAVLGLLVILFAWRYGVPDTSQEAELWEERYRSLDLPQPASWTIPAVREQFSALQEQLRIAEVEQEKAQRWADLAQERADLDRAYLETEQRREQAVAQYGVAPDLKEESLRLIAENLARWQAADANVRAKRARIDQLATARAELAEGLREEFARFGYPDEGDGAGDAAFEGLLADLQERYRRLLDSRERQRQLDDEIAGNLAAEIRRTMEARSRIFARAGLVDGDDAALKALVGRIPAWHEAQATVAQREEAVRDAHNALATRPDLREPDLDAADVQRRLDEAESVVAGLDAIREEIAQVRTRVSDAMRSRDVEEALGRRDDALHALRRERARVSRSVVGATLMTAIQQETRDASMPIVFHRARELFSIITRGRYDLQFEEGPTPAFTAQDTSTGALLHLDQLSSGTRVQLLMAIRLAFVENVEAGPRLPVLFDETLGNSDELRAGAIIDAAIDICRNGRQVFYFTAQGDEVVRWQARIAAMPEDERPGLRVVDLGEIREDAGFERLPSPGPKPLQEGRRVPAPDGVDRETYRGLLRVPGVDPWGDGIGPTHLWHMVDDPRVLYALLSQDVSTWGQLATLARTGGTDSLARLGVDDRAWEAAQARARLLETAVRMWRIGHGRPVTLAALAESGVVDEGVLDEVDALLAEVDHDGERLLEALREADDPPIVGKPLERLETWLLGERYIPQGDPISRQDLRARLIDVAREDVRAGLLDGSDIDAVMDELPE